MTRKIVLTTLLLAGMSLFLLQCAGGGSSSGPVAVGHEAPGFELQDLKGNRVSLDQYRGKIVMLDFWATWCGPCRMTMPVLEKLQSRYYGDFVLLAVNLMEPADKVSRYVREQNIHSTVLLDTEGTVGGVYQTESIPMQVLIDRKGIVRNVHLGYSPQMESMLAEEIESLK